MKSKSTAAALAILLGGLGMHKFYLGKAGQGVFYVLFCWTFIPAIFGLIEGLNYAFMSNKIFNERYNADSEEPTIDTHVRCPECRELVRTDAKKCKHCGAVLVPTNPSR
jgi:TM2 domain-containing membrane protein YozV